ncbi:hypothetical protein ROZALSC1DRAFT_24778 [Rozella allomycis CSF55]|uniref:Uncharacterized protein n=1 Tax=Rozella allomycis (strain CSF55) TaxID=988480 RepID=A0A4P9YC60_ROZAC|nr:hypothetical protein ROZALSC1DRAFT_24778 [Rozella allomycis CSF55]
MRNVVPVIFILSFKVLSDIFKNLFKVANEYHLNREDLINLPLSLYFTPNNSPHYKRLIKIFNCIKFNNVDLKVFNVKNGRSVYMENLYESLNRQSRRTLAMGTGKCRFNSGQMKDSLKIREYKHSIPISMCSSNYLSQTNIATYHPYIRGNLKRSVSLRSLSTQFERYPKSKLHEVLY